MSRADTLIDDLAGRVADGKAVDWDEAEKAAGDEEQRRAIRRLRMVAQVAVAHRDA